MSQNQSTSISNGDYLPEAKRQVAIIGTRGYPSFYGGFETLVRKIAPYMSSIGWSPYVYGRARKATDDKVYTWDDGVTSIATRGVDSKSLSTLSFGLTATLDACRRRPDAALILNVANGYWLPLLKARGVPTIVNVDGIEWERQKWGKGARAVFRIGAWLTAKLADELIFDSVEIGRYWKDRFGRTGTFIPYGGESTPSAQTNLPFDAGSYVLIVARFVPENTIQEFIHSVPLLGDVPVVIVGSSGYGGEYEAQIEELQRSRANLRWLGHVRDDDLLLSLWANCGVYFHGHSVGGTNPALVQAMACGAPTVARDTVFNREVLGDCALFVDPTASGIAEGISQMLADDAVRNDKAKRAIERAQTQYTWSLVRERYVTLLEATAMRRTTRLVRAGVSTPRRPTTEARANRG